MPGTNIVLIMTASDRTCLQLRQYLTTMKKTEPPFGSDAGRKMMETLFLSNWQHEKNGERLINPAKMKNGLEVDEVRVRQGKLEQKMQDRNPKNKGQPRYKRRRLRGGAQAMVGKRSEQTIELYARFVAQLKT